MQFEGLPQLLEMGGHGAFVWSAVVVSVAVLVWLVVEPLRRHRVTINQLRRRVAIEQQQKDSR